MNWYNRGGKYQRYPHNKDLLEQWEQRGFKMYGSYLLHDLMCCEQCLPKWKCDSKVNFIGYTGLVLDHASASGHDLCWKKPEYCHLSGCRYYRDVFADPIPDYEENPQAFLYHYMAMIDRTVKNYLAQSQRKMSANMARWGTFFSYLTFLTGVQHDRQQYEKDKKAWLEKEDALLTLAGDKFKDKAVG